MAASTLTTPSAARPPLLEKEGMSVSFHRDMLTIQAPREFGAGSSPENFR